MRAAALALSKKERQKRLETEILCKPLIGKGLGVRIKNEKKITYFTGDRFNG